MPPEILNAIKDASPQFAGLILIWWLGRSIGSFFTEQVWPKAMDQVVRFQDRGDGTAAYLRTIMDGIAEHERKLVAVLTAMEVRMTRNETSTEQIKEALHRVEGKLGNGK